MMSTKESPTEIHTETHELARFQRTQQSAFLPQESCGVSAFPALESIAAKAFGLTHEGAPM